MTEDNTPEPEVRLPDISLQKLQTFITEYSAGRLSNVKLGKLIGRTEGWVRIWAKKMRLEKNLAEEVRQRTMEKLLGIHPSNTARKKNAQLRKSYDQTVDKAIENAAETSVAVIREHQGITGKLRVLGEQLVAELTTISQYPEEMDKIAELIATADFAGDGDEKIVQERLATYRKVLTLGARAKDITNLANALTKILDAERKAFNLDAEGGGGGDTEMGVEVELLLATIRQEESVEAVE
ncbi:MAG: hypothetical protein KAV87_00100 [Desulfobacteraceae bacterium]|nr:hypothetical protein [Desulfobacteraceae bacterium]